MTLEKLPAWLRWVLLPFSLVAAFFGMTLFASFFVWLNSRILNLNDDSWTLTVMTYVGSGLMTGMVTVLFGVYVAPSYKRVVATIVLLLLALIGVATLLTVVQRTGNIWQAVSVTSTCLGAIAGVVHTFKKNIDTL